MYVLSSTVAPFRLSLPSISTTNSLNPESATVNCIAVLGLVQKHFCFVIHIPQQWSADCLMYR